jgi:hypothetical protein
MRPRAGRLRCARRAVRVGSAGQPLTLHPEGELPRPDKDRSAAVNDVSTTPGAPWQVVIRDAAP